MATSLLSSQGKLRYILENWQGEDVTLYNESNNLIIYPEYFDQFAHHHQQYNFNKKFTTLIKGRQASFHQRTNPKENHKYTSNYGPTDDEYVFRAKEMKKYKKGRSFTQMAEQYSTRRVRPHRQTNKTNYNYTYEFQFPTEKPVLKKFNHGPKYIVTDQSQLSEKIHQSLKDLNLHSQNKVVIDKIESLKKEMIDKIIKEGYETQHQLTQLVQQIKTATSQILSKHSKKKHQQTLPQLKLQKQLFSFEGMINDTPFDEQKSSFQIKVPDFKDNSQSISSIMSQNQENQPIQPKINIIEAQNKIFSERSMAKQLQNDAQIEQIKPQLIQIQMPDDEKEFIQEPTDIQKKEERVEEKIAEKIAEKMEEKMEEKNNSRIRDYKIELMGSRVRETEVIRLSPLRFRRKEEVVKDLVKHRIVEKQSDSIEFVH